MPRHFSLRTALLLSTLALTLGCGGSGTDDPVDMGPTADAGCPSGQQPSSGGCVPVAGCLELDCGADNRECTVGSGEAACGDCLAGFMEVGEECVEDDRCATLGCADVNRVCDTSGGTATCGTCLDGFFQNSNLECEQGSSCDQLNCTATNQTCVMDPDPRCEDGCVDGFVWDTSTSSCRAPRTCVDLGCANMGLICNAETSSTDAECVSSCPAGEGFDPQSSACFSCGGGGLSLSSSCMDDGETGRLIVEAGVANGVCFCETQEGYYPGTDKNAERCDADDDGWVSSGAVNAIENAQANVVLNARCDVREIDRFELVSEAGAVLAEPIALLPLYESPRNDGDSSGTLPRYGTASADPEIPANVLNSLSKGCATAFADLNDNGLADAEEGQDDDANVSGAAILEGYFDIYTQYAYFMELHDGYFIAGSNGGPGKYVIAERSRTPGGDGAIPFEHAGSDPYWRECQRADDTLYISGGATSLTGADFTCGSDVSCSRQMFHHSQFRCVIGQTGGNYSGTAESNPSHAIANGPAARWIESGALVDFGRSNDCTLETASYSQTPGFTNSVLPTFSCSAAAMEDDGAHAQWVVVDYQSAAATATDGTAPVGMGNYLRGCINECDVLGVAACEEYNPTDPNPFLRCYSDGGLADFGRIECGCTRMGEPGSCVPLTTVACTTTCNTTGEGICPTDCTVPDGAACTPPDESCNASDDDCDGFVDEGAREFASETFVADAAMTSWDMVGMTNGFLGIRSQGSLNGNHEAIYQIEDTLAPRLSTTWLNNDGLIGEDEIFRVPNTDTYYLASHFNLGSGATSVQMSQGNIAPGVSVSWNVLATTPPTDALSEPTVNDTAMALLPDPLAVYVLSGDLHALRPFTSDSPTNLGLNADFGRGVAAIRSPFFTGQAVVAYGQPGASPLGFARVRASDKSVQASAVFAGTNAAYPEIFPIAGGNLVGVVARGDDGSLYLYVVDGQLNCTLDACPTQLGVDAALPAGASQGDHLEATTHEAVWWNDQIIVAVRGASVGTVAAYDIEGVERWRLDRTTQGQPDEIAIATSDTGALMFGLRHGILATHTIIDCGP